MRQAAALAEDFVQSHPRSVDGRVQLAQAKLALQDYDGAYDELETLAQANSGRPLYHYWLARLDYDDQRFGAAIQKLQRVVQLDPRFIRAHDRLGLCFEALGDHEQAAKSFLRAIELNRLRPQPSPWPSLNYGSMLRKLNRQDEAEPFLREAVRFDPQLAEARYQLALALEDQFKYNAAAMELERATRISPQEPKIFYALGRVYRRLGRDMEADHVLAVFSRLKRAEERTGKTERAEKKN